MKRYTVAEARHRFSEVLDAAESGTPVMVERRGVRFVVQAKPARSPRRRRKKSLIEYMDPAIAAGQWTWVLASEGLRFVSRVKR